MAEPTILYNPVTQSFFCFGCRTIVEVRRSVAEHPEKLMEEKESVMLNHSECRGVSKRDREFLNERCTNERYI